MNIGERIKEQRLFNHLSQEAVAKSIKSTKQTVYKYENGIITNIPIEKVTAMALLFNVTPAYLLGWQNDEKSQRTAALAVKYGNILPISKKSIPMLGEIACGKPIFCDEDRESYVISGVNIEADFCLKSKGDSMVGARIHDGDIVFIQSQETVDNGQIAAVIVNDEATLKRVYYYPESSKLVLQAENSAYEPLVYVGKELEDVRIIGIAVAFQSDVR